MLITKVWIAHGIHALVLALDGGSSIVTADPLLLPVRTACWRSNLGLERYEQSTDHIDQVGLKASPMRHVRDG